MSTILGLGDGIIQIGVSINTPWRRTGNIMTKVRANVYSII